MLHVDRREVPLLRVERIVGDEHRMQQVARLRVLDVRLLRERGGRGFRVGVLVDVDDREVGVRRRLHRGRPDAVNHDPLRQRRRALAELHDDAAAEIGDAVVARRHIGRVRPRRTRRVRRAQTVVDAGRREVRHDRAQSRRAVLGDDGAGGKRHQCQNGGWSRKEH